MRKFTHVSLIYNRTGQVVSFYPPDAELIAEGAPTAAASYSIWRGTQSNDETALVTGTATLDAVATTISSASGYSQANRRALTMTATTSQKVGERYLAANTNTDPQREVIVLAQVTSATAAVAEEDLSFDYANTATFKGTRHYFTIDATFIATESNINVWGAQTMPAVLTDSGTGYYGTVKAPPYRVRWVYSTPATTNREAWTTFDVVRKPAKANLSVVDLRSVVPEIMYLEPIAQRGQDWQPQLVRAEADVALDLRASGFDSDQTVDPEFYDRLVLWRWVLNCGLALWVGSSEKPEWYDTVRSEYQQLREKFAGASNKARQDVGTKGSISSGPAGNLWLK